MKRILMFLGCLLLAAHAWSASSDIKELQLTMQDSQQPTLRL